jgi:hypothetical protein
MGPAAVGARFQAALTVFLSTLRASASSLIPRVPSRNDELVQRDYVRVVLVAHKLSLRIETRFLLAHAGRARPARTAVPRTRSS